MIAGSMVALVTPMDAQGRLDWDSLTKLVDFHLQEGTNAIVAVGTTGESATRSAHIWGNWGRVLAVVAMFST